MIFLRLFFEFFKIGLFSIGGGLASLPFLYELSEKSGWFTAYDISNLVAISEATPGPLGINMSTYVGYVTGKVMGALTAPVGLVFPSVIVIIIVAKFYNKFKESQMVKNIFYCLRPVSVALIATAAISVFRIAIANAGQKITLANISNIGSLLNYKAIILMIILAVLWKQVKKHPIIFIAISGLIGVVFQFSV